MNRVRAKYISTLIAKRNPQVLISIRNVYGEATERMGLRQLYRAAKRMWKEHHPLTKAWPKRKKENKEWSKQKQST